MKRDKLKLDDPTCSQYQIILDLMGKDEVQLSKEKKDKEERMFNEETLKEWEARKLIEDK